MKTKKGNKQVSKNRNGNSKLVAGLFRPNTKVAELYQALEQKPRSWKELRKLDGSSVRARVYGLRRILKGAKIGRTIQIADDKVRLVKGKAA